MDKQVLQGILDGHTKYLCEEEGGERADLRGAHLQGADLRGANLQSAHLPAGESFASYLAEVVPALCTAGGQSLAVVAGAWGCHSWENCPMAIAFGVTSLEQVPLLYRPRVEEFVRLFDAGLVPAPTQDVAEKNAESNRDALSPTGGRG